MRRARTDVLAHHESVVGVVYRRGVPHEDAPLSSSRRQSNSGLRSPSPDSRLQVAEDDDDDDDDGDVVLCRWIFKGVGGGRGGSCCFAPVVLDIVVPAVVIGVVVFVVVAQRGGSE